MFEKRTICSNSAVQPIGGNWLRGILLIFGIVYATLNLSHAADIEPFRVGFYQNIFTDVNENDAVAAIKTWGRFVARSHGVPVEPEVAIFKNAQELLEKLRSKQIDAIGVTSDIYSMLAKQVPLDNLFLTAKAGYVTERFVLLVHGDGQIKELSDLRGRSLLFYSHSRASIAPHWLDTLLSQRKVTTAAGYFGKINRYKKLSQVILPVFFRQADACVVTLQGFMTMVELNPQVGRQLNVIATSADVVPAVFIFRQDYSPSYKEALFNGLRDLHRSPAGQQVLTIFLSDKMEEYPVSALDSTLEMVSAYDRIFPGSKP